jgi:Flp pilus assembly protein TadD
VQRLAEIQQNRGAVGLELDGAREEADAVRVTAELGECYAKQLQEVGIIRRSTQQILIRGDRLAQAAGPVVMNGVLKTDAVGLIKCAHGIFAIVTRVLARAAPRRERLACLCVEAVRAIGSRRPPALLVLCSVQFSHPSDSIREMSFSPDPEVLVKLAWQDLEGSQLSAAEAKCLQVLGAHHHHPGALEVLGSVLHSQGRHEDAVRVFNALTLIQPAVAAHWEHLGTVLRPTERYAQALAAFERALQLGPPTPGLLYNLGVLQMDRCDFRAAHLALRDGRALAPTDGRIRWAFARCCYELGRHEEAVEALEGWQELEGLTVEFTVLIVMLLGRMGASLQAQPALDRLLENPPQEGRAALGVASILERLHRLDEARAVLTRLEFNDRSVEGVNERLLLSAALAV